MKDEVLRIFDKQTAHREKFSIQVFQFMISMLRQHV